MLRAVFLLMVSIWASGPLAAQEVPALYDVTGVATDDQLNVRAAPEASAPVIGALSHSQTHVEVTAVNEAGTWGRVVLGEQTGWASLAYLTVQPESAMPDAGEVTCFGTEPFWSYHVDAGDTATWSAIDDEALTLKSGPFRRADARFEPFISAAGAPGQQAVLVMQKDPQCSDGMSDALYGLSAVLVLSGRLERAVSGCCSLAPR
ncbi:COG3650 family protein [Salipiger abyssi]|uniref:COG3650 family protein n=1 Tax=Salipiger abyssi TaxID=1250539 RepID=UPI001A8E396F|nr:SH3 domain-containing protein [Salipiger abyssi]MBN9890031.1 SH3 domain-containing protein [Salipiger abyssi]